jgi:hypothetical protein
MYRLDWVEQLKLGTAAPSRRRDRRRDRRLAAVPVSVRFTLCRDEGVLTAMASTMIPPESRPTGLAFVASCIGFGTMGSSLVFGWIWQVWGAQVALSAFAGVLAAAVLMTGAALSLRRPRE